VRAEPSVKARIVGTLPPPSRLKLRGSENTPDGGWLTEFRIVGFKQGWFLIEGATPPGKQYEDETKYPHNAPKPYAGRGWVAANKVGANYANGATRMGGACFRRRLWMPDGSRRNANSAGRSIPTGGPSASWPAADSGDWWKAMTARAAGGAASAPIR
jgi:hypothetical protein